MKLGLYGGTFDPIHNGHTHVITQLIQRGIVDHVLVVPAGEPRLRENAPKATGAQRRTMCQLAINDLPPEIRSKVEVNPIEILRMGPSYTIDTVEAVKQAYPDDEIIFANGGDRTPENIPEQVFDDVEFVFGVGGDNKANSSSWILQEWKTPKTERAWGYYRVLHEVGANTKLKELTVTPKTCLSMQRHDSRAEFWFVAEGEATVYTLDEASTDQEVKCQLTMHEHTFINVNEWHQLCNETDQLLKLIEIQYGEDCVEEDIERK